MAGVWTNFGLSCGLFLVYFVARSGCFCSWLWLVLRQGLWPHCSMFYSRVWVAYYADFMECSCMCAIILTLNERCMEIISV